jgi:hypothetical protein
VTGNVSEKFVERAFMKSLQWMDNDFNVQKPGYRKKVKLDNDVGKSRKLQWECFQSAACTGVVATLVRDKLHVWQMGDAVLAVVSQDEKYPSQWVCKHFLKPKYKSNLKLCQLPERALGNKLFELKARDRDRDKFFCRCAYDMDEPTFSSGPVTVNHKGNKYTVMCMPEPKMLLRKDKNSLRDATTQILDVKHGDLVIMGKQDVCAVDSRRGCA